MEGNRRINSAGYARLILGLIFCSLGFFFLLIVTGFGPFIGWFFGVFGLGGFFSTVFVRVGFGFSTRSFRFAPGRRRFGRCFLFLARRFFPRRLSFRRPRTPRFRPGPGFCPALPLLLRPIRRRRCPSLFPLSRGGVASTHAGVARRSRGPARRPLLRWPRRPLFHPPTCFQAPRHPRLPLGCRLR